MAILKLTFLVSLVIGNLIAGSWAYDTPTECIAARNAGACNRLCCDTTTPAPTCYSVDYPEQPRLYFLYCDCLQDSVVPKFYCIQPAANTVCTIQGLPCGEGQQMYECDVGLGGPICLCTNSE